MDERKSSRKMSFLSEFRIQCIPVYKSVLVENVTSFDNLLQKASKDTPNKFLGALLQKTLQSASLLSVPQT